MSHQYAKRPRWRHVLTLRNSCIALTLVLIAYGLWIFLWPRAPIPVGHETTRLTEPIGSHGYIDYFAALYPHKPIPAEENAAGWYIRAGGINLQQLLPPASVSELATELGISEAPVDGEQFIDMYSFARSGWAREPPQSSASNREADVFDEVSFLIDRTESAPWTAAEFPHVVNWLAANETPLKLILNGASRNHYRFLSRSSGDGWEYHSGFPLQCQNFVQLLSIAANHAIGEGRLADAEASIDAIYKLATHHNKPPSLVNLLVSFAYDSAACTLEKTLIASLNDRNRIEQRRVLNRDRTHVENLIETIDRVERFISLSLIQSIDREARGIVPPGTAWFPGISSVPWERRLQLATIDTADCSRRVNTYYDMLVEALQSPPHRQAEKLRSVDRWRSALRRVDSRHTIPIYASGTLDDSVVRLNLPGFESLTTPARRFEMRHVLLDVAYAARLFEIDRGQTPSKRSDLVPEYLAKWPTDRFQNAPLEDAIVQDSWVVFYRPPALKDATVEDIASQFHWCRIDIPHAADATEPNPQ